MKKKLKPALRLLFAAILVALYFVVFDALFLIPGACENGRLARENGVWVLTVRGTPYEMGYAHGKLMKAWVRQAIFGYVDLGLVHEGGRDYSKMVEYANEAKKYIPGDLLQEIQGIADGAGVDFDKLLVLHTFLEYTQVAACSSYAVFGDAARTGELIHGYNLEFYGYGIAHKYVVLIKRIPDGGNAFVSVTWPGFAGTLSAMNDKGLCANLNNVTAYKKETRREGLPYVFLVRELAEECSSLEEAKRYMEQVQRTMGNNVLITQTRPARTGAVAEYTADHIAFRDARDGWVAATNHYRKLSFFGKAEPSAARCTRYERLAELITTHYGEIDEDVNFLKDKKVYQSIAIYSVLFYPERQMLKLACDAYPAPEGTYKNFQVGPVLIEAFRRPLPVPLGKETDSNHGSADN
jgi:hypothetical protein